MEELQEIVIDSKENEKDVKILTKSNETISDQKRLETDI